jgi:ferric-dicitrate binding protein FerR (iron transport regulator)
VAAVVTTLVGAEFAFRSVSVHTTTLGRTYATGPDQQATITLGDGTRVTLAPRTILRTVNDGNDGGVTRTVVLEGETGEAYFEVTPSSSGAFQVRSGMFTTRVLGTTFMVRHPVGSPRIRVAVAEGKVSVTTLSQRHPSVTLTAGTIGEVDDSTVQINTVSELAPRTEWVRGRLVFRDMSVATVLQTLSHWYGYQFRCPDSTLALQTVTIGVNMRSSSAALATLEDVLRVNLTVVGDTVTLTPQATRQEKSRPRVRSYDVWTPTREVGR